jgi:hypothetical protein
MKLKRLPVFVVVCSIILTACSAKSFSNEGVGYGLPGESVHYKILIGNCIGSLWATQEDGLALTLSGPDGATFFEHVASQAKKWGSSVSGDLKPVYYEIEIPIPAGQAAPADFSGTLTGTILCPVGGTIHNSFTNKDVTVNKIVELHVVTEGGMKQLARQRFWKNLGAIGMIAGAVVGFFILYALYLVIKEKLPGGSSRRRRYR